MKISISTYSFYKLVAAGGFTWFDAIDKIKELGCDGAEICYCDRTPDGSSDLDFTTRLTDHAHSIGLEVPIYTTGADFLKKDVKGETARVKKNIDIAAANGIPVMRHDVGWGFPDDFEGLKTWQNAVEYVAPYINDVSEYAASKGVVNCSENHGRLFQDSDRLLALFDLVGNPNYRWLCDIGNFGGVDEDCAVAVSKLLPFLCHVHVKDAFLRSGMLPDPGKGWSKTRAGNYRRATILGHGDVPVAQILGIIRDSGYDGWVSLEFEGLEDVMTAVSISIENLRKLVK
jgi:sugar phosphate isomerase/epimerase